MTHLSGEEVRRRMRMNGHTIRGIAKRWNITMKRVRLVRQYGVDGGAYVQDWLEFTGPQRER